MVNYGPDPFYIPNAFTPNGDGVNDFYQIFGIGIKSATVTIFNRWGGQVFYGDNLNATWDGTHNGQLAQTGTYVYNVYIIYLDQRTERVTGSLMLLR
jgi:gliding motility-associated-like protein